MRVHPILFLVLAGPSALAAQWQVALRHGTATSHGDAQADLDPAHPELQANRPRTWTLALAREYSGWRLSADLHRTTADLAEISASSSVTTNSVLAAWGVGLEAARRIAGRTGVPSLLLGGGVTVDRWTFDVAENAPRTRIAVRGALEAELPISRTWSAVIRGELLNGSSVFTPEELPEGFSTRRATRLGIALGIARLW